jgi:hypothetical protein
VAFAREEEIEALPENFVRHISEKLGESLIAGGEMSREIAREYGHVGAASAIRGVHVGTIGVVVGGGVGTVRMRR